MPPKVKMIKPQMEVPVLDKDGKDFSSWKIKVKDWCDLCKIPKSEQARHIRLYLEGTAFEMIKHIDENILNSEQGVAAIIEKLDELYIPDKLHHGRQLYRKYHELKKREDESMVYFIQRFLNHYYDVKKFNDNLMYDERWVVEDLLQSCNLSEDNEKIVTAQMRYPGTLKDLTDILKRVFPAKNEHTSSEPDRDSVLLTKATTSTSIKKEQSSEELQDHDDNNTSFYGRNNKRQDSRFRQRGRQNRRSGGVPYQNNRNYGYRNNQFRTRNRMGNDGRIYKCYGCQSETHILRDCPDLKEFYEHKEKRKNKNLAHLSFLSFVGCASVTNNDEKLNALLKESYGYALLDSGCSKTVAGEDWINDYISKLSDKDSEKVKLEPSTESFTFGDGKTQKSLRKITFPCWVGGGTADITADIVKCKIPLLLSRKSMSKVKMIIDFANHKAIINEREIFLKLTTSGHYGLPISL